MFLRKKETVVGKLCYIKNDEFYYQVKHDPQEGHLDWYRISGAWGRNKETIIGLVIDVGKVGAKRQEMAIVLGCALGWNVLLAVSLDYIQTI